MVSSLNAQTRVFIALDGNLVCDIDRHVPAGVVESVEFALPHLLRLEFLVRVSHLLPLRRTLRHQRHLGVQCGI